MTQATHVIIGASLAGAKAAETLRADGFDGRVVLVGDEAHRPYERPPLSKGYLQGTSERHDVFVHDDTFYADHDIELLLGQRATAIDPDARTVTLDGKQQIGFDRLLLATGAAPRRLDIPGADLDGIHYLRTLDDADALDDAFPTAQRVAVIGAGWIGTETAAAAARHHGLDVALIDPAPTPLHSSLGPEVGAVYADIHTANGVELHLDTKVTELLGTTQITGVRTADGTVIDADLVVVGIGAQPNIDLAANAGLTVGTGVDVSSTLETTAAGIFAAGDVAAAWHPWLRRRLRIEHWANALNQGVVAGHNMLGAQQSYDRVPYFYSDQYDLGMEYSGHADTYDEVVFRGDPASGQFIAFWVRDQTVCAAMNANVWDVIDPLQALIRSQHRVNPHQLSDPDIPLHDLPTTA